MTQIDNRSDIYSKIQLLWILGDWNGIVNFILPEEHSCPELISFKIAAFYQLGQFEKAKAMIELVLPENRQHLKKLLISGIFNCIAKSNYLLNKLDKANNQFTTSVNITEWCSSAMIQIRKAEQLSQINIFARWAGFSNHESLTKKKKLFLDCGGHDGCSVVKFLLSHPEYEVITFEANPELWRYYEHLTTQLIGKAVYDYDGEVEFLIDPIDADGSSLIKEKNIDFHNEIKNEDCPKLTIPCVDLSSYIKEMNEDYSEIVLKLDVEGAEYAILKKMIKDGTIKMIKKLYAEFHWHKIGVKKEEHDYLIEELNKYVEIEYWDAHEFSVHKKDKSALIRRHTLIKALRG